MVDPDVLKKLRKALHNYPLLYVEENSALNAQASALFKNIFDTVYATCDATEALDLYERYRPAIVVADIKTPLLEGLKLAKNITAILSPQNLNKRVDDFESHRPFLESFHRRYMASNVFCRAWVREVRRYEVDTIAPQHGSLFRGGNAAAFLEWFENVEGGAEHIDGLYLPNVE